MSCIDNNKVMKNKMLICEARIKVSRDGNTSWVNRNVEYQTARMTYDNYDVGVVKSKLDREMFCTILMRDVQTLIDQTKWNWLIVKFHVFDSDYNYLFSKSIPNLKTAN